MEEEKSRDIGTEIMDLLIMLLEDQTGKEYEYRLINEEKDKTA